MRTVFRAVKAATLSIVAASGLAAESKSPEVRIRLPERSRFLTDQRFDLRVEATGLPANDARITMTLDGKPWKGLPEPASSDDNDQNEADHDKQWTYRSVSLLTPGVHHVRAEVTSGGSTAGTEHRIGIQEFKPWGKKSLVLVIGDAMGSAYRDAGRIVSKGMNKGMREGFYDELLAMDRMPVSGMVMTHALNSLVPDSANTASAWATGNKTSVGGLSALPDNDDFKIDGGEPSKSLPYATNNPRVESLWEYLKRRHGYRTGIVTTAEVTDATPAAEGAHVIHRGLQFEIARQFVDGSFSAEPPYDVLLGGGRTFFQGRLAALAGDDRDLATELVKKGYAYAKTRTDLLKLKGKGVPKVLGLFHDSNMTVAYDKLGLARPAMEPLPEGPKVDDQPFLNEMVTAALSVLGRDQQPFVLLVEGASIDKQSHLNRALGTIWDVVELDHAVKVVLDFANQRPGQVLTLVTADHDQTMSLLAVVDSENPAAVQNLPATTALPLNGAKIDKAKVPGAITGFPDYQELAKTGYPDNTNRYKLAVGFRTGDHAATSVPITAAGPGALMFTGYFDQTDVFFKMARALGTDTRPLDKALSVRGDFQVVDQNAMQVTHH